jgi:hypothetical protein
MERRDERVHGGDPEPDGAVQRSALEPDRSGPAPAPRRRRLRKSGQPERGRRAPLLRASPQRVKGSIARIAFTLPTGTHGSTQGVSPSNVGGWMALLRCPKPERGGPIQLSGSDDQGQFSERFGKPRDRRHVGPEVVEA